MTKAMRWGFSAVIAMGCCGLGSVVGCSEDDPGTPVDTDTGTLPTDTGQPVDTGTPDLDTGTPPGDSGMMGDGDTGVKPPPDRAVSLLFGVPDMTGKFVCLGAFATDPAMTAKPAAAQPSTGALGRPDSTAPTDPTKTTAFQFGDVVPVPLNDSAIAALKSLTVALYWLDANPFASGKTCSDMWDTVRTDPKRYKTFPKESIVAGEHGVVVFQGCEKAATADGACGAAGNNFEVKLQKVTTAKPATGDMGVQFLHLSQFPGNPAAVPPVPGWQGVDIYLALAGGGASGDAGTDASDTGGDGGTTAPTLVKIAENVKYNDAANALQGITLPAGVKPTESSLVIGTRISAAGSLACMNATPAPTATCPNWTIPLTQFLNPTTGYPRVGGGLFPKTNQLIALIGAPAASATPPLRIAFLRSSTWP